MYLPIFLLSLLPLTIATGPSAIISPTKGTRLKPGGTFRFQYNILADYCASFYNFNVYLFTSAPTSFSPAQTWATGHFYGRFAVANYPGNPSPSNPVPSSLPVPDFRTSPGGFGNGMMASDQPVWLAVLEETGICSPAVGARLALTWVELVYNATRLEQPYSVEMASAK